MSAAGGRAPAGFDALTGLGPALRLLTYRCRVRVLAWVLPLWGLAAMVPSYQSAYPTLELRAGLIEGMRASAGTRLLYGVLPYPGTVGQLAQWEVGSYLLTCVSLMAVLLTCRLLRADEDEGLVEVVRGAGAGRWVPLAAPVLLVAGAVGLLAAGVGVVLHVMTLEVTELTVAGAWAVAGTVAVVGWAALALAVVVCQLARSGPGARGLSLACLGVAFGLRVAADEAGSSRLSGWLRWVSPLGWRDLVRPYTQDRTWPLLACTCLCLALLAGGALLYRRREYLGGYLPDRASSRRRWRVRGHADLLGRLAVRSAGAWAVAAVAVSVLFGAMSGTVTTLLEPGSPTQAYVALMAEGSPVVQFLSLLTVLTVLLVVVAAVGRASGLAAYERAGLVEVEAAAGVGRTCLFLTRTGAAVLEGAGLLVLSGGVLAAAVATQVTVDHAVGRALVFTLSQLPGLLAAVGLALALVGLAPRYVSLVWAVVAWSVFAQFFGGLVRLPRWARDLSVLGHHLDVVGPVDWWPLVVQAVVGAAGILVGLAAWRRRDLGA